MAECILAKYYGMGPGEIEEMSVRSFNEYLKNIPAVERVFNGAPAQACDPDGTASRIYGDENGRETAKNVLSRYGLAVPTE